MLSLPSLTRLTSATLLPALLPLLLTITLCLPTPTHSQTFTFTSITTSATFTPRTGFPTLLTPSAASRPGYLYMFGGSNGVTNNDVWQSSNGGTSWTIISGNSTTGSATGQAATTSFPPTVFGLVASDVVSGVSFHYGGYEVVGGVAPAFTRDTYYSTDAVVWTQAVYTAGAPQPDVRELAGALVTTSNTARDTSFLLVGGVTFVDNSTINVTSSALVWKSSAAVDKPTERLWTAVGSTLDATGYGFLQLYAAVVNAPAALNGRDVLYVLGGIDVKTSSARRVTDAVWASSDEGASWVQLAATSFGPRFLHSAAVTPDGVLFVIGGLAAAVNSSTNGSASLTDMWASFDGGYTWSLCTNSLPPRDTAAVTYDPQSGQLIYGLGFDSTADGDPVRNDLYSARANDASVVATACGTTVPSAGAGIKRWPLTGSSSTGGAVSGGGSSSAQSFTSESSSGPAPAPGSSSSSIPTPPTSSAATAVPTLFSSSSSSSSSTGGSNNGGGGGGEEATSGSSNTGLLTAFIIIFAGLTVACSTLAYTQYRLRVYGTVCCEWCAGVTCGQLCGETVGWGTKWQRRSNLSDADLLRQVASDRYD